MVVVVASVLSVNNKDEQQLEGFINICSNKPSSSSIQQTAILPNIKGRDVNVIAQAPSATGKSSMTNAAVVAGQMANTSITKVQVLTLSSTRKISSQTMKVILAVRIDKNVQAHACIGGKSKVEYIRKLEYGVHFVSGTSDRISEVLDKSDEMLSRGFKDQIHAYDVHKYLPPELQVVEISRTIPTEMVVTMSEFMSDPIRMLAKREELTLEGTKQFFFSVEKEEWKFDSLWDLHHMLVITQAVIFCRTKQMVDGLCEKMRSNTSKVLSMHGDMPQMEQYAIRAEFRQTNAHVLIATNLCARWLDVEQTTKTLPEHIDLRGKCCFLNSCVMRQVPVFLAVLRAGPALK